MNDICHSARRRYGGDDATAAVEQMKDYCAARPGSPSAVRRPQLFFRSELWVALLGPNLEEGIVGIGATVAAALRAFDARYLTLLRSPDQRMSPPVKRRQSFHGATMPAA